MKERGLKMRDLRMPKGWKHVGCNVWSDEKTDAEKRANQRRVNKVMRNCKTLSVPALMKEADNFEKAKSMQKASYEAAKKAGKLWTKSQKEKAKAAKKLARREKRLANKSN